MEEKTEDPLTAIKSVINAEATENGWDGLRKIAAAIGAGSYKEYNIPDPNNLGEAEQEELRAYIADLHKQYNPFTEDQSVLLRKAMADFAKAKNTEELAALSGKYNQDPAIVKSEACRNYINGLWRQHKMRVDSQG